MDTLESIQNQMKATEGQMSGYGADLPGEIESQLQKAYTPALQQSLGVTKDLMGDYLGRYFDTTTMGPGMAGTTAKDLSPTQKLGVMGRELGTMAGDLQTSSRLSDYLGGQMNDMYGKAMQAAQMGQQSLADQYNRLGQQQQMLWQQAEAEKDRALQREMAARSGGGGGGDAGLLQLLMDAMSGDNQEEVEDPYAASRAKVTRGQEITNRIQQMAQALSQKRAGSSGSYSLRGQKIGGIDDVHRYLLGLADQQGIQINPEWLWRQLGNT